MTDQQIPADDLRRFIARCRTAVNGRGSILLDELEALLPDPPRPTLADMTNEERRACEWMRCDVADLGGAWLIIDPFADEDHAHVIGRRGNNIIFQAQNIIPRPDLPRMEWPGTEKPTPATALPDGWRLADHPQYGPVVVTSMEPDDAGFVWFVRTDPYGGSEGYDAGCCKPDVLTFLTEGADTPTGTDHLAVGTVIESADDPRIDALPAGSILLDRDDEATIKLRWAWTGLGYNPVPWQGSEFGPWTVRRIGREDDQ